MARTVVIDPITRIEGHLGIRVEVEDGVVSAAYSSGESYRGFEQILQGRAPLDAQHITQRICGVCPIEHGVAANLAQEMAFGVVPTTNGMLLRNIIAAANFIQSHIMHFYTLSAVDFIDVTAVLDYTGDDATLKYLKTWVQHQVQSTDYFPVAPLLPRFDSEYVADLDLNLGALRHYAQALDMRTEASKMGAFFGGKLPHAASLFPGGVSQPVKAVHVAEARKIIQRLQHFIETAYVPDVVACAQAVPSYFQIGTGPGNFLSFGVFHEVPGGAQQFLPAGVLQGGVLSAVDENVIREDIEHSYFSSASGLHPSEGESVPLAHKENAYSWLKAPRYDGRVMEVGPLARMLVAYHHGDARVQPAVNALLSAVGRPASDLDSVLGRHAARALECQLLAERTEQWIEALQEGAPSIDSSYAHPVTAGGYGLTEAARGALGHWIQIENSVISRYQCVVPTTWNCSPRDASGVPGSVEQALVGCPVADPDNPIEAVRIVRSFDPCLSCAVH